MNFENHKWVSACHCRISSSLASKVKKHIYLMVINTMMNLLKPNTNISAPYREKKDGYFAAYFSKSWY